MRKISNISIPSRKRSHIAPWKSSTQECLLGGDMWSFPGGKKMSQTLPSFQQLDLPYSPSGKHAGLMVAPLPTSQRVSQWWHSLPAASVWEISVRTATKSKMLLSQGLYLFMAVLPPHAFANPHALLMYHWRCCKCVTGCYWCNLVAIPWNLLTLWVEVLESYAGRTMWIPICR